MKVPSSTIRWKTVLVVCGAWIALLLQPLSIHGQTWDQLSAPSGIGTSGSYSSLGVESNGWPPSRRQAASATNATSFYVYGGTVADGGGIVVVRVVTAPHLTSCLRISVLGDLWRFNSTSKKWTWVSGNSKSNVQPFGLLNVFSDLATPGGRRGSVVFVQGSSLYLFGGYGERTVVFVMT